MCDLQHDAVELANLSFSYPGAAYTKPVLNDLTLEIKTGEFICIIGHSGCGKSTLLNILAGLLPASANRALLANKPLTGPGTDRAVVFQHYSLFPWMTALQNVVFGIRQACKKLKKTQALALAENYLRKVSMWDDRHKYPYQLSGGMQQRVALARALAMNADLLLLDEPFGALDAKKRTELQQLLEELWLNSTAPKTVVFITHDIEEAILLADRIVFMQPGRISADLPVLYPRPRRREDILGSPEYAGLKHKLLNLFYFNPELDINEVCN